MRALRPFSLLATCLVMGCGGKTDSTPAATPRGVTAPPNQPEPVPAGKAEPEPTTKPEPEPARSIAPTPTPALAAAPAIVQTIELTDPAHHVATLLARPDGSLVALCVSIAEEDRAIHLLAYGPDGKLLWYQTYGDHHELAEKPNASGVALADGGFIAVGRKKKPNLAQEVWLARFGASGQVEKEVPVGAAYARVEASWIVPADRWHILVSTARGEISSPTYELFRVAIDEGTVTHSVSPEAEIWLPWRGSGGELRAIASLASGLEDRLIDPRTAALSPAPDSGAKWEDASSGSIWANLSLGDGTRVLVTNPIGEDTTTLVKTNDQGETLWSLSLAPKDIGAAHVATLTADGLALTARPATQGDSTAPFRILRLR